jgi:predicted DNA-binding antitoxin AbrB/MazE fold protein
MFQVITATFEDGVLKPTERLDLRPHSRVRLTVEPLEQETADAQRRRAWEELELLWRQSALDSQGERLSRDQLHERR